MLKSNISSGQYIMPFKAIPSLLEKYSFQEKMRICQGYSSKCINEIDFNQTRNSKFVFPWEIEIFALFSIMTRKEYKSKSFTKEIIYRFINSIRSYKHPQFDDSNFFKKNFFMATLNKQIKYQENKWLKLYRFNYIYNFINNKINMQKIFLDNFGCDYTRYVEFEILLSSIYSQTERVDKVQIINDIIIQNQQIVGLLTITRKDFKIQQKKFLTNNIDSYYYAFNLLLRNPFISFNNLVYFPLPHLLIDTITSSLLYRLTENNDGLREKIGKEVIESYLLMILKQSKVYKEIVPEIAYRIGKNKIFSPDVMVYKNEHCVLFDCKLSVPSIDLRNLNENIFDKTIERCASSIKKTYDRVLELGEHYKPFRHCNDFKKENKFGVVIWLEDNYIPRKLIYDKVAKIMNEDIESSKMKYIKSNIKLVGMKDIEECALLSRNYIDGLIIQRDSEIMWYDIPISKPNSKYFKYSESVNKYKNNILSSVINKIEEYENKVHC